MQVTARMQDKRWVIRPENKDRLELAGSLKASPLLAQVLLNRGISDVQEAAGFLRPKLTELIPPEEMPGAVEAVVRVKAAVEADKKITVYGDYDVDGITGVSILWQVLTLLGAEVDYYIPHRIDEGYGLKEDAIRSLRAAGTEVIVTVDCGINAISAGELAEELGIELIITDHHQPDEKLPKASAIVHPILDPSYANQSSAGAMVAFKLAWAIANGFSTGEKLDPKLREFMINATSLAAMGTVADVMDLRGENRVLTSFGLKSLSECKLCGVEALIETAGLSGQGLSSFHIGFRLAPLLNAAGRMGHARLAVELLTSDSKIQSMQIAEYLKQQNNQRRLVERKIFKQACEKIVAKQLNHPDRKTIVLHDEGWHTGIIGIVASRIIDKFYRPVIMINSSNGIAQGSARSVKGFDLLGAITACSEHLTSYGGHKMAAGLTIETEKIEAFAADLEAYAAEHLDQSDVIAKLYIDAEAGLNEINKHVVDELGLLGPFGQGNPEPVFATRGVRLVSSPRRVGANGDHLQIAITDNNASIRCIGFGMGKLEKKLQEKEFFNVAYQPNINTYNGSSTVQLVLLDVQFD